MNTRRFTDVEIGERFGDVAAISEWHIATASALYYDAGPNHMLREHAAKNRFGGRIAHGFLTTGIMMGVAGRHFGWSIEAFLEAHTRLVAPVYMDETIHVLWEVTDAAPKAAFSGGIVTLRGWCWAGQPERLAVEMDAKLALNDAEAPPLHDAPTDDSRAAKIGLAGRTDAHERTPD